MSALQRVTQWQAFSRVWHLFDAKWQNPFESAPLIVKHLQGRHKPLFHPMSDCGDMVVVINTGQIALPGPEWTKRVYFHHTGYPGGASWTLAWEVHEKDPTMIIKKAVYTGMKGNIQRRITMQRLKLYHDDQVPDDVMANITNQIRGPRPVPVRLPEYSKEFVESFPRVADFANDYVMK